MFSPLLRSSKKTHRLLRAFSSSGPLTSVTFENGIKQILMCHEKTRNSLSLEMMQNLITNINADEPDLRVIVIGAKGPVFSAGHNLKELTAKAGRENHELVFRTASKLMSSIIDAPVPIVARVDGLAAAAGCQLVAQCDMAFCTERSTFSTPGANFGIFCSTPGVALARCVPKMVATQMLFTGLPISSAEAASCGLVTKVSSDLDRDIGKTCDAIKTKSKAIIELGKRFYYKQIENDIKTAYRIGEKQMVDNLQMVDGQEGISSFVEKRRPFWKHGSD